MGLNINKTYNNFVIERLGESKVLSPMELSTQEGDMIANFVRDDSKVLPTNRVEEILNLDLNDKAHLMEKAGAREKLYFNPMHVHAAVVTCGGLCPGLNDVIRSVVRTLSLSYNVTRITGICYGYRGFDANEGFKTMELNSDNVDEIHKFGGTVLGSARGGGDPKIIADALERMNVNILFTIGGDGTLNGALAIHEELTRRGLKIAIIGIPKTIDNDLSYIAKSFGFDTAVSHSVDAISAAHTEAKAAINGIGLVKLMGRQSGFIAAHTALASHDVNYVLVPEVDFELEGPKGLYASLEKRLKDKQHAVIVVAEGAGVNLIGEDELNKSQNERTSDIGVYLKNKIIEYFKNKEIEINLKYIDPSYLIRASAPVAVDALYCFRLGTNAVHAAMAGRTGMVISYWNSSFVHIPIKAAIHQRSVIDPDSSLWRDVLLTTHQPALMVN